MARQGCSIEGCERPHAGRGFCAPHYQQFRRDGGQPLEPKPQYESCTAEGCSNPPAWKSCPFCTTHYARLRRTGTTAEPVMIQGCCIVDGCQRDACWSGEGPRVTSTGYCRLHSLRIKVRGDAEFTFRKENHNWWTGGDVGYDGAHDRIKAERGSAAQYPCVDCGGKSRDWSYDNSDPNESIDERRGRYSLDTSRYVPRCPKCHRRFDVAARRNKMAS